MMKKKNILVIIIAVISVVLALFVTNLEYWLHSSDPKEVIEYQNIQVKEIIDIIYVDDVALVLYQVEGKEQKFSQKLLLYKDGKYQLIRGIEQFIYINGDLVVSKYKGKHIIYTTIWGDSKDYIEIWDSESSKFECTSQEISSGAYVIGGIAVLDDLPKNYWIIIDGHKIILNIND